MGLIAAAIQAGSSTLKDQWLEYFYCDALPSDVLMVKGHKRTKGNNKGDDNIITNGSIVAVADGQCMIIVEQGRIMEICAEPGEYKYDIGSEPSVFSGSLGKGIIESFKTFGRRFAMGGDTGKDQRVYYFNTRPTMGNLFGTQNPIPFRIVDNNIGLDIDVAVRCNGQYMYQVVDPILFYTNVSGNVREEYSKANANGKELDQQMRSEFLTALQPAFAKISELGIRYSALPGHTQELCEALNEALKKDWLETRGIMLTKVTINSVTISKEDEQMIKAAQAAAINRNPNMAAATLVTAQAQAMQDAAKNKAGAVNAFMGMGMAGNMGGMNAQQLFAMGQQQAAPMQASAPVAPAANTWTCSCGTANTGKFCMNCGTPQPAQGWTCSCGTVNQGKFCQNCGSQKPADAPLYKCDKCGWTPEDPKNPPRFCPECGDVFDENDAQ